MCDTTMKPGTSGFGIRGHAGFDSSTVGDSKRNEGPCKLYASFGGLQAGSKTTSGPLQGTYSLIGSSNKELSYSRILVRYLSPTF